MAQVRRDRVFSVSYIGDLVTAASVLPLLAAQGRAASFVAAPAAAPLFVGDPRVAAVHLVRSSRPLGWRFEVLAHLVAARRTGEGVVNLEVYAPRWAFVVRCCRWLRLAARHIDLPGLLADNQRSARREATVQGHRSDYYALAVGGEVPQPAPRLLVDTLRCTQTLDRLHMAGPRPGRLVLAHLGASSSDKRAPLDLVAALLGRLERGGSTPVIVGAASEAKLALGALERLGEDTSAVDACGRLDLGELAALASQARLFIGGDSGPLKIAEAVGTPTVSFWHSHLPSPEFGGPRGPEHVLLPATAAIDEATSAAEALLAR